MREAGAVAVVIASGLAEAVIGLAWAFALVVFLALVGVFVQMRRLADAQRTMDERVADLERALGTGSGR